MPISEKQIITEIRELKTIFLEKQEYLEGEVSKLAEKFDVFVLSNSDNHKDGDTANEASLVNYFEENYSHLRDMGKCFVQEEAYRQRRTNLRMWRNLLNQRKLAYYNAIKCRGMAETFTGFIECRPAFIPRKYREKINPQDTEIQRNIKEDLSVSKLKANIQILEDKTVHYSTKYLEIDEELLNEIKSLCTEETHDFLETLWDTETKREEDKSRRIWSKKENWLQNLPQYEKEDENRKAADLKKKATRKQQEANIRRKKEGKARAEQHRQFAAADYYEPPRASGQTLVKSAAGTASNQERTFVKKPVGKRTKINASTACSQEQTSLKQPEGKQKTAPLPGRKRG